MINVNWYWLLLHLDELLIGENAQIMLYLEGMLASAFIAVSRFLYLASLELSHCCFTALHAFKVGQFHFWIDI
jgi:hypothetical protein